MQVDTERLLSILMLTKYQAMPRKRHLHREFAALVDLNHTDCGALA